MYNRRVGGGDFSRMGGGRRVGKLKIPAGLIEIKRGTLSRQQLIEALDNAFFKHLAIADQRDFLRKRRESFLALMQTVVQPAFDGMLDALVERLKYNREADSDRQRSDEAVILAGRQVVLDQPFARREQQEKYDKQKRIEPRAQQTAINPLCRTA